MYGISSFSALFKKIDSKCEWVIVIRFSPQFSLQMSGYFHSYSLVLWHFRFSDMVTVTYKVTAALKWSKLTFKIQSQNLHLKWASILFFPCFNNFNSRAVRIKAPGIHYTLLALVKGIRQAGFQLCWRLPGIEISLRLEIRLLYLVKI